ncbi:MAG: hypothetical protein HEQ40_12530 [Lacibacter sp.]|jgi:uncharacterized protein YjbI with pentapeptide repeats
MGEILIKILTSSETPWFMALIIGGVSGWWALKRYRYEKHLEKFKETNANLFKDRKQEVLAAIATLSIFKRNPEFEKNTIDVLLSRLYTELDYDVINSILSTLIQDSNRKELLYIASGLQDINRNFFVQDYPTKQRVNDLNKAISKMEYSLQQANTPDYNQLINDGKVEIESFLRNKDQLITQYNQDFINLASLHKYKLAWHKQVTADAYAMFLRKAYLSNPEEHLSVKLFQNDFNYVYMAEIKITETTVSRSALASAIFAEVEFAGNNISRTDFFASVFNQSGFYEGKIKDSIFERNSFTEATFKNIHFTNTQFTNCKFESTKFINCAGLTQQDFIQCTADVSSKFPEGVIIPVEASIPTTAVTTP